MKDDWADILHLLGKDGGSDEPLPSDSIPWECYHALARDCMDRPLVIAQVGQSLDGRIATESGHSHYINGPDSLDHLHRLRAMADAVIVGATTAVLDNPRLTTRRVPGPNPVRVIIDPHGRVPANHALLSDGEAETLIITAGDVQTALAPHCARVDCADGNGRIDPGALLEALRKRGLRTVLIEGGGHTISSFLTAGFVDRLQVAVAPLIIGSGRPGLILPEIEHLDRALRFRAETYRLGEDTLFDCHLRAD